MSENNTRYTLTFDIRTISFNAPLAKSNLELVKVLEELILDLKIEGECKICSTPLLNNKDHTCIHGNTSIYLCNEHGGIGFKSDCTHCNWQPENIK